MSLNPPPGSPRARHSPPPPRHTALGLCSAWAARWGYYRCWRLANWPMAKPWHWKMWSTYRYFRAEQRDPRDGTIYGHAYGRLRSAWLALTFPHVHHESEE